MWSVLDEDTPELRREKAFLYLTYLKSIFLKKWPTEAIKTFIKEWSLKKWLIVSESLYGIDYT